MPRKRPKLNFDILTARGAKVFTEGTDPTPTNGQTSPPLDPPVDDSADDFYTELMLYFYPPQQDLFEMIEELVWLRKRAQRQKPKTQRQKVDRNEIVREALRSVLPGMLKAEKKD